MIEFCQLTFDLGLLTEACPDKSERRSGTHYSLLATHYSLLATYTGSRWHRNIFRLCGLSRLRKVEKNLLIFYTTDRISV